MMLKHTLLVAILFLKVTLYAQNPDGDMSDITFGKGRITEFSPSVNDQDNDVYISDSWRLGSFRLNDGNFVRDLPLKYSLKTNELLVQINGTLIKAFSIQQITLFEWNKEGHSRKFNCFNAGLGPLELLIDGQPALYKQFTYQEIKSNYNEALAIGSRTDQVIIEENYYIELDTTFQKLPKSKRRLFKVFQTDQREALVEFIKNNNLKFKTEKDFVDLVIYWNSLN